MKISRTHYTSVVAAIAMATSWGMMAAQSSSYSDSAHHAVFEKMIKDFGEKVSVSWVVTNTSQDSYGAQRITGKGLAFTKAQRGQVPFTYDVTIYPNSLRPPRVSYDFKSTASPGDVFNQTQHNDQASPAVATDDWFQERARALVERELERQTRKGLTVEFAYATMWNPNNRERGVKGTGAIWTTDRTKKGTFTYEVRFNRETGKPMHTEVKIESKPG